MLSLGKLAPGQQEYYLSTVAKGVEDYYVGAGEAPGEWMGLGAGLLDLDGQVDADELHALLDSLHPTTGARLTRAQGAPQVPGFDATFSAPKSVSLLFGLGSPEIANEVRNAHDAAVARTVSFLEHEAASARRGKGGLEQVDADGFVGAAFRHRTSRAGDPQLHTHVLIANVVHAPSDDRWSALDARPLYRWSKTAGYLYEAQLRAELTRRLGVTWGPVHHGIADLDGFSPGLVREFSTRRQQIEDHLDARHLTSARAAQVAAYATRTAKDTSVDAEGLVAEWRTRAAELGYDQLAIDAVCDQVARRSPAVPADDSPLFVRLAGPEGLTAHRSTFTRRDVIMAICEARTAGGDLDEILATADTFLRTAGIVPLAPAAGEYLHRDDGGTVPAPVGDSRFTTREMLATEERVLDHGHRRRDARSGIAGHGQLAHAVDVRPTLTSEQRAMVTAVCSSGAGVEVVEGVAGAGKTFALAAAHDAWTASGFTVHGVALAARAAQQIEDGAGIPSQTLDRFLLRLDRGQRLLPRDVVVVDEAAMVGTRTLLRLLDHAETAGAKVVLVGDPRQLPEIDAGGAFVGLRRGHDTPTLTDNRRQRDEWERAALAELRAGDPDQALAAYEAHDRIHTSGIAMTVYDRIVTDWLASRAAGEDPLMLAARRVQVDQLNRRARAALQAAGEIGPDELAAGDRRFALGDRVVALRNDYPIGVLNGTTGTLTGIDRFACTVTLSTEGRPIAIPFDYLTAGDLTHAYALTIHKAQGATADRALLLADDTLTREHLYTALSRGRARNDLYLVTDNQRAELRHAPEIDPDDILHTAAHRSGAKTLALDELPAAHRVPTSPALPRRAERITALRHELDVVEAELAAVERALADARARRDKAIDGLAHLPLRPSARRQTRAALTNALESAHHEIAKTEPVVNDLRTQRNLISRDIRDEQSSQECDRVVEHLDRLTGPRRIGRTVARAQGIEGLSL